MFVEPLRVPAVPYQELPETEKTILFHIVREFVNNMPDIKKELGIEHTEETFISLYNKGIIKFLRDEQDNIHFGLYDFEQLRYVFPSLEFDKNETI